MTDDISTALARYPTSVTLGATTFRLRMMTAADGDALMVFARELPAHDTLHMRRDITQAPGIAQWLKELADGSIYSLLGEDAHGVAGYSTINLNELEWTRHVADLRMATATRARGLGPGRLLAREAFNLALALEVEKVIARMTPDQTAARVQFRELGFTPEALLRDHVKDRHGEYHDLLLKTCSVRDFLARCAAYGRTP
jgi:L-amino acid N-acyltransferase YncA